MHMGQQSLRYYVWPYGLYTEAKWQSGINNPNLKVHGLQNVQYLTTVGGWKSPLGSPILLVGQRVQLAPSRQLCTWVGRPSTRMSTHKSEPLDLQHWHPLE